MCFVYVVQLGDKLCLFFVWYLRPWLMHEISWAESFCIILLIASKIVLSYNCGCNFVQHPSNHWMEKSKTSWLMWVISYASNSLRIRPSNQFIASPLLVTYDFVPTLLDTWLLLDFILLMCELGVSIDRFCSVLGKNQPIESYNRAETDRNNLII